MARPTAAAADAAAIDCLLRLAGRLSRAPVQLHIREGAHQGVLGDAKAAELGGFVDEVVAAGRPIAGRGSRADGRETAVFGVPVVVAGQVAAVLCAIGVARSKRLADGLAEIAQLLARELAARVRRRAAPVAASGIPPMLREIVESAPFAMAVYDREIRLLAANSRWEFDLGLKQERLIGRRLFDVQPSTRRWEGQFLNCLNGERLVLDRFPVDLGDRCVVMNTVTVPWYREDGEVGGVLGMYRNISETEGDGYELELTRRRLQSGIELGGIRVWEFDYRNKAIWFMGDQDLYQGMGTGFLDLAEDFGWAIHPDDRAAAVAAMQAATRQRRTFRAEYRLNRTDKDVWVSTAAQDYFGDDGELETRLVVMVDITQRKAAETALVEALREADAANRAKSDFLATISHEIRTPLNGVLGMARAMAADELSPVQRERLDVVRQSGEMLLTLLNDVLDISKIEAGKLELELEPFDIAAVAKSAVALFEGVALGKGLQLELSIAPEAAGGWMGDSTRIHQILANLVSNGLKFTEKGKVAVEIAADPQGLVIRVADTGIGISPDQQVKLFQKFEQADASMTRRFGGTGLGLAICRELAELMRGSIEVASMTGHGAAFTVRLPLARAALAPKDGEPGGAGAQRLTSEAAAGGLRVLAAEDNRVNQLVLRALLSQAGIDPVIVDDGAAALEAWAGGDWDLILLDVQMPRMDGPAVARAIRQREAQLGRAPTPIIALTANVMSHHAREYELAGMTGFVAKPIEVAALFAAIEQALEPATEDAASVAREAG